VVFYTAHYGEREARALALSSGVSYVLTKPAESQEVLTIVGRVLSSELETGMPSDAAPLTPAFDRDHLRLLTATHAGAGGHLATQPLFDRACAYAASLGALVGHVVEVFHELAQAERWLDERQAAKPWSAKGWTGTTSHSSSGKGHSAIPISSASVRNSKRRASPAEFVQQPPPAQYQPRHGDASVRQIT
jgi:hypothetical protein